MRIVSTPPPACRCIARRLQRLGLGPADLASRTGWALKDVDALLRGVRRLTPESAVAIEEALGISAVTLMHTEVEHRVWQVRLLRARG